MKRTEQCPPRWALRFIEWYCIGELLLSDALKRAYQASSTIGACAVMTDPINEKVRAFYESFGFISLESGRMFIPTIKASFLKARVAPNLHLRIEKNDSFGFD